MSLATGASAARDAHLADYLVPVNLDVPHLEAYFIEEHDPYINPRGLRS